MQSRFISIEWLEEIKQARFKMAARATRLRGCDERSRNVNVKNGNVVKLRAVIGRARSYHETHGNKDAISGNSCHICSVSGLTELIRGMYFCLLFYVLTGYF